MHTLEAACHYQFSLVKLTFLATFHKNFLSHLTNTLQKFIVNRQTELLQTHLDIGGTFP